MALLPPRAWLLCRPALLFLSSHIYCTGELLRQVQRARLFQDDKDFVDMPLKSNPGECPPLERSPLPTAFITWRDGPEWRKRLYVAMQRKGCLPCRCYAQRALASRLLRLQSTGFPGLKGANASPAPPHPPLQSEPRPDLLHLCSIPPDVVLKQFEELMNATPGGALSKLQLAQFVEAHFFPPGQELESWTPPDWTDRYSCIWKGCGDKFPTSQRWHDVASCSV